MTDRDDHVFVICAYQKSKYLEDCVRSLLSQTVSSRIMIATSTPNEYISDVAKRYSIPLYVNEKRGGIAADWQFAYEKGAERAGYVTLAHQDDIYLPHYTETVLHRLKKEKDVMICFTDYAELRDGKKIDTSPYTAVKRALLMPLCLPLFRQQPGTKRRILMLGNPVMCPTVTYRVAGLPEKLFESDFKSNADWECWERLSTRQGSFVYEKHTLLLHRIHNDSTTAQLIGRKERALEDYAMFLKFWPESVVRFIMKFYSLGERNYRL